MKFHIWYKEMESEPIQNIVVDAKDAIEAINKIKMELCEDSGEVLMVMPKNDDTWKYAT